MKICNKCKIEKPLIEFPVRKYNSGKIGVEPNCKECKRKSHREHLRKKRATDSNRKDERQRDLQRRQAFPEKEMWMRAKKRAYKKNISFTISVNDIIMNKSCPLLGIPLIVQTGGATDNSPSLDRIDTTLGYVPGNVAVISRLANIMKAHADKSLLLKFASNISNYIN